MPASLGPQPSRRGRSHGSVAVEFALVMPLFLMLIALIVAFGQAMWARSQMLNFISSTARLCALQLPVHQGTIRSCLSAQMNEFSQAPVVGGCRLNTPTLDITQDPTQRDDAYQPNACIARFTLSCQLTRIPFAAILQGGSEGGMNITVKASFPYLPNFNRGLNYNQGC